MIDVDKQLEIIRRGIDSIVPEDELQRKLQASFESGKPLRVKYGIDPTGIDVHLGHTVPLRKLRQFQELGHTAVVIIGNYTALVGDPSGRDETRSRLTHERVQANAQDYLKQIEKVIDMEKAEVHCNGDWFSKMEFRDVIELCSRMTVARLLERDDFKKRIQSESAIYLHECLYPLMQGWDSVEIKADIELGGSEQLFSLMVARELQKAKDQSPQVAVTLPILVGTDGTRRMGKSLGNYIGLADPPNEMYGKVMSIPDDCMRMYFELLTDQSIPQINELLGPESNPRAAKGQLANDVVAQYYGETEAKNAESEFKRRFSQKRDPTEIPEASIPASELEDGRIWIAKLLKLAGLSDSTSNARRAVQQGGVTIGPNRTKVTDPKLNLEVEDKMILRIGSRRVVRIVISE